MREGIEDYRILSALNKYLSKKDLDKNVRDKIEHLINVSLPELVDPAAQAVQYGQSRSVIDNLASEEKMDQFREEMIESIKSFLKIVKVRR